MQWVGDIGRHPGMGMGMGGIPIAAAEAAGAALRTWGDQVGEAVAGATRVGRQSPKGLADGLRMLRPVDEGLVRTTGWELRHAFAWNNDGRCIQRAGFGAAALLEREAGDLARAVGWLGPTDAGTAAGLVAAYGPTRLGNTRLHTATLARSSSDEALVIDHLVADGDDGVLALDDWLRRIGSSRDDAVVYGPLREPPLGLRGGPGIPVSAGVRSPETWRTYADHLAIGVREAAERRLPQVVRMTDR